MNVDQMLRYLADQRQALQQLISQLEEIQVRFNAQYDSFKAEHDATLDHVTRHVAEHLDTIGPDLRTAISDRLPLERERIDERRQQVAHQYLPKRQEAADTLLQQAQAELARLQTMNPALDEQEEVLKRNRTELETRLAELNAEIRAKSRGLGVLLHFRAINNADRERQRLLGRLEALDESLYKVRSEWQHLRQEVEKEQKDLQERWQLESIAVARLRSELDQLSDPVLCEDLALRRATRHTLDTLKKPLPSPDPRLENDLRRMADLNIHTDAYHEGLAAVGGLIGLLGGIDSGMQAICRSVESLAKEQEMHRAYLKALSFHLPERVRAFHSQWSGLIGQFEDETVIGEHPATFADTLTPLLQASLSQTSIESMFADLGAAITQATATWH